MGQILIAGFGNILRRDDGVGVHAVRALKRSMPLGCLAAEFGTAVLSALCVLEASERILVIDAMQAGGRAGTVYLSSFSEIEAGAVPPARNFGRLLQAFHLIPPDHQPEILVVGIEPLETSYGMGLSGPLRRQLPNLLSAIRICIEQWRENESVEFPSVCIPVC